LGLELSQSHFYNSAGDNTLRSSTPYTLRARWNIVNSTTAATSFGIQAQIRVPRTNFTRSFMAPKLGLSAAKPVNKYLTFKY
jgi:hypothetical protein